MNRVAIVQFREYTVSMPENMLRYFNKEQLRNGKPMLKVIGWQPTLEEILSNPNLDIDPAIRNILVEIDEEDE